MTKEDVTKLAKKLANVGKNVTALGMQNTFGKTHAEIVSQQARYQIAMDQMDAARQEYNSAFASWKSAGFPE